MRCKDAGCNRHMVVCGGGGAGGADDGGGGVLGTVKFRCP